MVHSSEKYGVLFYLSHPGPNLVKPAFTGNTAPSVLTYVSTRCVYQQYFPLFLQKSSVKEHLWVSIFPDSQVDLNLDFNLPF